MTITRRGEAESRTQSEREAFERLASPHHDVALGLAARMLGNLDDAEDALQDALLKAYRSLSTLRDPEGFRSWMLRIVYHQCLDQARRRRTRQDHEQRAPAHDVLPAAETSATRDVLRRVREVMQELPPKQRAALHLRVFEELDYRDVGAIVGLTPRSARVYVVKARRYLRERLERELEER